MQQFSKQHLTCTVQQRALCHTTLWREPFIFSDQQMTWNNCEQVDWNSFVLLLYMLLHADRHAKARSTHYSEVTQHLLYCSLPKSAAYSLNNVWIYVLGGSQAHYRHIFAHVISQMYRYILNGSDLKLFHFALVCFDCQLCCEKILRGGTSASAYNTNNPIKHLLVFKSDF